MVERKAPQSTRRLATSPAEARLLTELERLGIAIFSLHHHRPLIEGFTDAQLLNTVHSLRRAGWLLKIEKGVYLVVPRAARGGWSEHPFVIAAGIAPLSGYYVSYWSALSHHDLTEQLPRTVYVALCERQKRTVVFGGRRYRFVRVTAPKFYGFAPEEFTALNGAARVEVQVADPEKAVIDSLDQERLAGGAAEVAKAIRRGLGGQRLALERLFDYAARFPNRAVAARLGYLLERFGVGQHATESLRHVIRRRGPAPCLAAGGARAEAWYDARWHLHVNLSDHVLDDESE